MSKNVWDKLINDIGNKILEIETFRITNGASKYFTVKVVDNYLEINESIDKKPSSILKQARMIGYKEFDNVFAFYDEYVSGHKGVRSKMSDISRNTSYILSLIKYAESL